MVCLPATNAHVLQAFTTLERCEATGSLNRKLEALEIDRHNPVLRHALELALDPKLNFYLRDAAAITPAKVWEEPLSAEEADTLWQDFVALLSRLDRREVTGTAARDAARELLACGDQGTLKWFTRILLRDLRCGFGTTLARRVWPDFLTENIVRGHTPYLGCMLSLDLGKIRGGLTAVLATAGPDGVEASYKLDGFRFTGPCENGECRLYTRGAQRRPYLDQIEAELAEEFQGFVVDGEVYTELDSGNWNEVASLVNRTKTPITPAQKDRLRFYMFDLVPLAQYRTAASEQVAPAAWDYAGRAGTLDELVEHAKAAGRLKHIELVPYRCCRTVAEIEAFYAEALARGFEGLVLKPLGLVPYMHDGKRPENGWVKLKPQDDETVEVREVLPGTGRNAHRMGSVRVRDGGGAEWCVGLFLTRTPGASDRLRTLFWQHRQKLIGVRLDVRSQRTKTREGKIAVSFPKIVRIRADLGWGNTGLVGGPEGNVAAPKSASASPPTAGAKKRIPKLAASAPATDRA